jgi:hypothetical protein
MGSDPAHSATKSLGTAHVRLPARGPGQLGLHGGPGTLDDVRAAFERLLAMGATPHEQPVERGPGRLARRAGARRPSPGVVRRARRRVVGWAMHIDICCRAGRHQLSALTRIGKRLVLLARTTTLGSELPTAAMASASALSNVSMGVAPTARAASGSLAPTK